MNNSKEISDTFLKAIDHERNQDIEQTTQLLKSSSLKSLVKSGFAISNLSLLNIKNGIGGKLYLEFGPNHSASLEITKGQIKIGDIVTVQDSKSSQNVANSSTQKKTKSSKKKTEKKHGNDDDETTSTVITGVITKINDKFIMVALDEEQEQNAITLYSSSNLSIIKTVNEITYKRMESTMRKLSEFEFLSNNKIVQYLLNETSFSVRSPQSNTDFNNQQLNQSQKDAINFALSNDISIIHGPPGTGKTFTLIELIQQLVSKGERVLVCGPSNISVDTILERLAKILPNNLLLRIGHPARLLEKNLAHSLDVLSKRSDSGLIVKDILIEIDKTINDIKKLKSFKDRREGWKLVKELRKELRERERKVIYDLILEAKVVVSTLHGSSSRELLSVYNNQQQSEGTERVFDTLIIDEVSQSLEPQCWIPIISHYKSNFKKLVLAGDNKQLPPTIKTADDNKVIKTLSTTLFDRLVKNYGEQFKILLDVQYRMNDEIMKFPSKSMYHDKLIADDSVKDLLLSDLHYVDTNDFNEDLSFPIIWYDTQGDDFPESEEDKMEGTLIASSKFNGGEALQVKDHVINLLELNVKQEDIGIISPYNAQVSYLKKILWEEYPMIEISTVDGFQGREKEVIIYSLVRSNDKFEVGFLKEERRMNVAITRPKKQLCIIGNIEVLQRCGNKYLKEWATWCEDNCEIRYPDISELLEKYE